MEINVKWKTTRENASFDGLRNKPNCAEKINVFLISSMILFRSFVHLSDSPPKWLRALLALICVPSSLSNSNKRGRYDVEQLFIQLIFLARCSTILRCFCRKFMQETRERNYGSQLDIIRAGSAFLYTISLRCFYGFST